MDGRYLVLLLLGLTCVFVSESRARHWSPVFNEGQLLYSCVGKRVVFPWQFQPSSGDRVILISWIFHGFFSSETMATFTRDDFLPSPEYTDRTQLVGNTGIALDHVTTNDSGNYSIEVSGLDSSGDYFTFEGMASLQVANKLLVEGDKVILTQKPEAVKVKDTGKWRAALACGNFSYYGVPPFPVHWTTPSGDIFKNSDDFKDGHFIFLLPNPVRGGKYSCEIPHLFAEDACLSSDLDNNVKATITVDETQVRLTLLEAHQMDLLSENAEMKSALTKKTEDLASTLAQKTAELESMKSQLVALEKETTKSSELIYNQLTTLEFKVEDVATPKIAFNAMATKSQRLSSPHHVKFDRVLYNQGGGYNPSTGDFTAPANGTYFIIFHTKSSNPTDSDSKIMAAGEEICFANHNQNYDHGSCHAAVYLSAGDSVWVEPWSNNKFFAADTTSFSGFLISD